jgi:hypothetical protein
MGGQGTKRKKKGRATGGVITGVKLWIKEKRQVKVEEEECMERKVHIGNKWWKIKAIYSKEMNTTRTTMKENREDCILLGEDFSNGRIGERGARNWEEERGDGKIKSKAR